MSNDPQLWLNSGQGEQPAKRWTFSTDAPLAGLALAIESRETLLADTSGGLYRLGRDGAVAALSRSFHKLTQLASDGVGRRGAAVCEGRRLICFDRKLQVIWTVELPVPATALSVDPQGEYIAVALDNGKNVVYDANHQRALLFETVEPLGFLQLLASERGLVGATEFGRLTCWDFEGDKLWSRNLKANIGDLSGGQDGGEFVVAAFTEGIKRFDAEGGRKGSYLLEGTPHLISTSFMPYRLAAATLEGHLYWLDEYGDLVSGAALPAEVFGLKTGALGDYLVVGFESGRVLCLGWD